MKRLLIFSVNSDIYEESQYVLYLLEKLMAHCKYAIICTSKNIDHELYLKLREYSENIVKYDTYIDINRWKDAWSLYRCTFESDIDEVIFVNDSVYGPLYSFSELFEEMDKQYLDFWGISVHGKIKYTGNSKEIPRFIQTYFFAVRKNMFESEEFEHFLNTRPFFYDYDTAMNEFEFVFTDYFEKAGYKWGTYVDTTEREKQNSEYFISFILFDLYQMVVTKKFPFIPKVLFEISNATIQTYNMGDDLYRTISYVKKNLNYDTELIYQNIIKRINLEDLIAKLNLVYILKGEDTTFKWEKKYAVFAHLFYEDLFEYSIQKLLNVPACFDIFISTNSPYKAEKIQKICEEENVQEIKHNICIKVFNERGRDLSSLLICHKEEVMKYDVIGFIHDKKSSQMHYITVGENFNRNIWENMLYSTAYVTGIMKLFEEDNRLGFVSPPMVNHGTYFHTDIDSWTICYEKTLQVADKLGVSITIDKHKNPVALGSAFWCKAKALEKLFQYNYLPQDFPNEPMPVDGTFSHAVERIFPYVAQEAGYYTGIIMTEQAATVRLGINNIIYTDIMKEVKKIEGVNTATSEMTILSLRNLVHKRGHRKKKVFLRGRENGNESCE